MPKVTKVKNKNNKKEEVEKSESSSSNSVKNYEKKKDDEVSDLQESLSEEEVSNSDNESEEENSEDNSDKSNSGKNFISNEFKEKVLAFIKIDDIIRKKNEEIKEKSESYKFCEANNFEKVISSITIPLPHLSTLLILSTIFLLYILLI